MKKKEIILPEKRYEKAPSEELSIQVNLEESQSFLTNSDRDVILDTNALFNDERNNCSKYKIYGKLKMIFRNMYLGTTSYSYLGRVLALEGDGTDDNSSGYLPYNEFAFLRTDSCREQSSEISVGINQTINSLEEFDGFNVSISGTTGYSLYNRITNMNSRYYNWNFYLSYVYDQDSNFKMKYTLSGDTEPLSFVSGDGIPFRITDMGNSYKLTSPVNHGMSESEYVIIDENVYEINSIGDEIYDSENYVINILKSQISPEVLTFSNKLIVTGKRCIDKDNITGTTSQYYIHKHKTLTTNGDYTIDKIGFESPIWKNEQKLLFENLIGENDVLVERNRTESILYDFTNPYILSGITNNLGYLPTEIYVSVIFRNGNGYFQYPPKVGYRFNFHNSWIDQYFDGEDSNETGLTSTEFYDGQFKFTSGNTVPVGTVLNGAFVEYNQRELKERIISESYHKIIIDSNIFDHCQTGEGSAFSGATETNPVGLFYQPHYRVKLRELSPYTESYTNNGPELDLSTLPQNAKYFSDEKIWKWRDLYDHGYIDDLGNGTNYPYLNDTHYVKTDINFYLKNEVLFTNKQNGIYNFNRYINSDKNTSKDSLNC